MNSRASRRASSSRVKHISRWVIKERLPFFVHSKHYRIYKFFVELTTSPSSSTGKEERDISPAHIINNIEEVENRETVNSSTNQRQGGAKSVVYTKTSHAESSRTTHLPSITPTNTDTSTADITADGGSRTNIKCSQNFPVIADTVKRHSNRMRDGNHNNGEEQAADNGRGIESRLSSNSSRPPSVLEFHNTDERTVSPELMKEEWPQSFVEVCFLYILSMSFSRKNL